MIKKMTSKELMDILENSQNSITELKDQAQSIRDSLEEHIHIIANTQEYLAKELHAFSEKAKNNALGKNNNTIVIHQQEDKDGVYGAYGTTVHPAFLMRPTNVFNFDTEEGPIYRKNAVVQINDIVKSKYTTMLMHDGIPTQQVAFDEFDSPELTLEVIVTPGDAFEYSQFDVIELLPHIPGSFSIKSIDVYTMQDYNKGELSAPSFQLTEGMEHVGASRLFMGETLHLYKCVFHIELHYKNNNGKYPFGLQHLYFLKGMDAGNSYVVVPIKSDRYIQWISEDITINDQFGKRKSTCTDEGIKLYLVNNSGALNYEVETSKGLLQHIISKNVKTIFAKIPLNRSIISLTFDHIEYR